MILTYLQITWWNTFKTVLTPAAMMDGKLRPKGNQTHFLVYGQGNCIGFRDDAFRELSTIGHVHQAGKCGSSKLNDDPTNITKVGDQWGISFPGTAVPRTAYNNSHIIIRIIILRIAHVGTAFTAVHNFPHPRAAPYNGSIHYPSDGLSPHYSRTSS